MCTNNVTYSNILPNMEIKEKIDFLRRKGWTLSAISDELGVGRETAYGWIARGHSPSNIKLVNNTYMKKRPGSKIRRISGRIMNLNRQHVVPLWKLKKNTAHNGGRNHTTVMQMMQGSRLLPLL